MLVPPRRSPPEQPLEERGREGAEDPPQGEGDREKGGQGQPLPPHELARAVALELRGHPAADPAVGQRVVPAVDPGHGLPGKGPDRPLSVPRPHDEDRAPAPVAVGHLTDAVDARGQAVLGVALGQRRERVEVDVEVAVEDGPQPVGKLRSAALLARRELQVTGRRRVVALPDEVEERAHGGAGRVGGLSYRLWRGRGRGRGGGLGEEAGEGLCGDEVGEEEDGQEHERGRAPATDGLDVRHVPEYSTRGLPGQERDVPAWDTEVPRARVPIGAHSGA